MATIALYGLAAIAEIAGCFAFWAWMRQGAAPAWLLTRTEPAFAGRAFAAYGGVYIVASLLWLWGIEGTAPTRWDLAGGAVSLLGAALILWGGRAT